MRVLFIKPEHGQLFPSDIETCILTRKRKLKQASNHKNYFKTNKY